MKIEKWMNPTKSRRTGKTGARAIVRPSNDHGWPVRYHVDSHGLSPSEFKARLDELEDRHAKWANRQTGFGAALGVEIVIDVDVFRIVDCTAPPVREYGYPTVIVDVRQVIDQKLARVEGFPYSTQYASLDALPTNAGIIDEVRQRLQERRARRDAHNAYTANVNALVKEG